MRNFDRMKIIVFLWSESRDRFWLFLTVFGWYWSTNKKYTIFIRFKFLMNHFIRNKILFYFWRVNLKEKRLFFKKKILNKKIMHLKFFIFIRTFFLIASYQIQKNDVILINHESFYQEKDSLQLNCFQFLKWINYYQIQQFVYKSFVLENWVLIVSTIKEFISEKWER